MLLRITLIKFMINSLKNNITEFINDANILIDNLTERGVFYEQYF